MKKLIVCIATMFVMLMVAPLSVSGQQTARKFIVPKSTSSVNLRQSPNSSAKVVGQLNPDFSLPVVAEQAGWYQVVNIDGENVWVSASVCKVSNGVLNMDVITDYEYGIGHSYDEWAGWSVARVKGTDMYVACTISENMDVFPWGNRLWLGVKEGNTLVFDRYVFIVENWSPDETNFGMQKKIDYDAMPGGMVIYTFSYDDRHVTSTTKDIRPSVFSKKLLDMLFDDAGVMLGEYLYLGPETFLDKYRDVEWP